MNKTCTFIMIDIDFDKFCTWMPMKDEGMLPYPFNKPCFMECYWVVTDRNRLIPICEEWDRKSYFEQIPCPDDMDAYLGLFQLPQ